MLLKSRNGGTEGKEGRRKDWNRESRVGRKVGRDRRRGGGREEIRKGKEEKERSETDG